MRDGCSEQVMSKVLTEHKTVFSALRVVNVCRPWGCVKMSLVTIKKE